MKTLGILAISTLILFYSCRKNSFISSPDARVSITADTLKFDTVFVTAGSIYQYFKIINENDQKLKLSSVQLMGGPGSSYKMNIDGVAGPALNDIELEPNDSVYVFVQVNIDPNAANLPFVIRDSIQVNFNGNKRWIQLEAWGKNAHFFRDRRITANETWINDLPYVILGSLSVDPNVTLTINKGCKIYLHANAPLIIEGSLKVNGLKDTSERVYFQGDRLDEPYRNYPASWPGIYFPASSKDNVLTYAVIKNAFQSIVALDPSSTSNPKVTLNECVIDNSFETGILAINSSVSARNCLISNCGRNLYLVKGGTYDFNHCTVATIASSFIEHKEPVLTLTNFVRVNNNDVAENLTASFRNCIFWGESGIVDEEVFVMKRGNTVFNVSFTHSLWKVLGNPADVSTNAMINNHAPRFDSINTFNHYYDFRLMTGSPAIDKGIASTVLSDLDGKLRGAAPDMGCFEK